MLVAVDPTHALQTLQTVSGGNFIVGTLQADAGWMFTGSSIEVSVQMSSSNLELNGVQLTIESGASWLLGTNSVTGRGAALDLSSTTIENVGQVVLTDGVEVIGLTPSTFINRATVSSSGATFVMGTLIFDQAARCVATSVR